MENFLYWFLIFIIYSFFGWIIETTLVLVKNRKFVNRGFMIGCYCPVYGVSALLMIFFLSKYKDDALVLFILSVFISSSIEYITSYIMEKIFKARWWDYSKKLFNVNGRICLVNSLFFGIFGILLICYVHPFISNLVSSLSSEYFYVLSASLLTLFIIDFINSFKITFRLKKSFQNLKKDSTEEISKRVREALISSSKMFDRVLLAFPNFKPLIKKKERKKFPFFK